MTCQVEHRSRLLCTIVLTMLLAGCPKPPPPKAGGAAGREAPHNPLTHMIQRAGAGAAVVLVVRPDRWSASRAVLAGLTAGPDLHSKQKQILGAADLWSAVGATLEALGRREPWPGAPSAWDRKRPLVLALISPPPAGPLSVVQAAVSFAPMSFRSRVLVPATNSRALVGELASLATRMGCKPPRKPGNAPAGGGTTLLCEGAQLAARFLPREDHVEIELLHSGRLNEDELKAAFAPAPRAPGRLSNSSSPALRFMESSTGLVSAYARPWQLRSLLLYLSAMQIPSAVYGADPNIRSQLQALGISELFMALLATSPEGAELEDAALDLNLRGPSTLHIKSVITLTGHGEKLLSTITVAPGTKGKPKQALVSVRHSVDPSRLARIPLIRGMPLKRSLRVVKQGGAAPYLFTRKPLCLLGVLRRAGRPPELERWVRRLKLQLLSFQRVRLPDGVLAEYEIDGGELRRLAKLDLPGVRGRLSKRGRALTHEAFVSRSRVAPVFGQPWSGEGTSVAPPSGSAGALACLHRLYGMLSVMFSAQAGADPAKRIELLVSTPGRSKEALACALADPATREQAREVQAVLVGLRLGRAMKCRASED